MKETLKNIFQLRSKYIFAGYIFFLFTATSFSQSVIANLNGDNVSFTEGGAAVLIDSGSDATVTNDGTLYDTGNLTVSITSSNSNDDIIINTGSGVDLSAGMTEGSTVTVSGTLIGSIAVGGTGQDGSNLVITLNASAADALLETLIHNLSYSNDSDDPASSRTVNLTITNANSVTSLTSAITVSITGINDAPTLTATGDNPTFTEDSTPADIYSSVSVSTIESGQTLIELQLTVTNVYNGSDEILYVDGSDVALTDGNSLTTLTNSMTVNVSLTGNTATVTVSKVAGISTASMQTLVDGITYRNENNTPNTSDRVVTLISIKDNGGTLNGGSDTKALSIGSTITVVAANDAPTLDPSASPAFSGISEDLTSPVNGSTDNSVLVTSIIDDGGSLNNYADAENDLPGIAVTGVNSGSLWYSVNNGTNWTELTGTISSTSALVLFADANTRIYFEPNANVTGTVNNAVVFKAWDRTSGQTNGTTAVNTTTGTAFSTATDDISIEITDINDPPTLISTPEDPTYTEGDPAVDLFSSVTFSTVESGQSVDTMLIVATGVYDGGDDVLLVDGSDVGLATGDSIVTSGNSVLATVSLLGDTATVTLSKTGGIASAVVEALIENLAYKNTSGAPNTTDKEIFIKSIKDDGGSANGGSDTSVDLDSTVVTVISINDAPVLDNTKSPKFNGVPENISDPANGSTLYSTLVSDLIDDVNEFNISDLDNYADDDDDPPAIAVTAVNAQGTIWYSVNNGTNWTELTGTVSETSALVVFADNNTRLYYKPDNGVSGTVTDAITFKAWDRTSGQANGTTAVNTTVGTAFSTATDVVEIDVADINYPPTLNATALDPTFTEGDSAKDLFSTVTVDTPESGQLLIELVVTVSNVLNGSNEILSVDGTDIILTNGFTATTSTNGMSINVTLFSTTATVEVTKAGGISAAVMGSIIDGLKYNNTSNNPLGNNRVIQLTSLKDDGGSANGSDTGTYTINSTVTIQGINEPPVISNLNGDNSSVVAAGTAGNIDVNSDASVTNPDSPDSYGGSILIIQTSGTLNGSWNVDGTTIKSGADGVIDTSEAVYVSGIQIGTVGNSNNGQSGDSLQINLNENSTVTRLSTFINGLQYSVPSGMGNRVFSLTLDDGDGSLYGGNSSAAVSFTITVTQNPPVISGLNGDSQNYQKGAGSLILDKNKNATVADPDSPNFDTGNLTVAISSGLQAGEDELVINTSGSLSLSAGMTIGSNVRVDGVLIGAIQSTGNAGNDLVITFNANSTLARVDSLVQAVAYNNTNSTTPSLVSRTIDFSIQDAAGVGSAVSDISSVQVVLNSTPTTTGISDVDVEINAPNTVIDLTTSFNDADEAANVLTYTIENISNPSLFTSVFISGYTLVLDYTVSTNGSSTITIKAADSFNAYVETTFTVMVGEEEIVTNSPVVTINTGGSVSEGGNFSINSDMIAAENSDGTSTSLNYIVTKQPSYGILSNTNSLLKGSSVESSSFTQDDLDNSRIHYIHEGSETLQDYFSFIVVNENDLSSEENTFFIEVFPVNDAPEISGLQSPRMKEDETLVLDVSSWFSSIEDAETPDSSLSINISCTDANINLVKNDNVTYTITTAEDYFGSALLNVVVSDGQLSSETNVLLIVDPVNDPPIISGLPEILNISGGELGTLNLLDYISDKETPDSLLRLSFSVNPDSILFDYKPNSGKLTFFVYGAFTGDASLTVTVTDEQGGNSSGSISIHVAENQTSAIEKIDGLPVEFKLFQNYPNPFNPITKIRYGIPETGNVSLVIYDILGNQVCTLINTLQSPGFYEYSWNASNYSSGIYIYVLTAGDLHEIKKMALLK